MFLWKDTLLHIHTGYQALRNGKRTPYLSDRGKHTRTLPNSSLDTFSSHFVLQLETGSLVNHLRRRIIALADLNTGGRRIHRLGFRGARRLRYLTSCIVRYETWRKAWENMDSRCQEGSVPHGYPRTAHALIAYFLLGK